jgi:DNA-binding XRE family transcriptional regulator
LTAISDNRRAVAARRFLYLFEGKVLLFSESAMIRAPNSLVVVRPCLVVSTPSTAVITQTLRRLAADGQPKSVQCYEMRGIQCKLARTALGWGVRELAKAANVSQQTVSRLEKDEQLRESTLRRIQKALEDAGIEFIPENGGGLGIRFKRPSQT